MGGNIKVASQVNEGSLFRFEIDARELVDEQPKIQPPSRRLLGLQPGQPTFRILVVDDKEENRHFLREMLQAAGFTTRDATNGLEAIRLFEEWQPHLILMDVRMPVVSYGAAAVQVPPGSKVYVFSTEIRPRELPEGKFHVSSHSTQIQLPSGDSAYRKNQKFR